MQDKGPSKPSLDEKTKFLDSNKGWIIPTPRRSGYSVPSAGLSDGNADKEHISDHTSFEDQNSTRPSTALESKPHEVLFAADVYLSSDEEVPSSDDKLEEKKIKKRKCTLF